MNPRKNKKLHSLWLTDEEYLNMISYLDGNYKEEAMELIFQIYKRGDLI